MLCTSWLVHTVDVTLCLECLCDCICVHGYCQCAHLYVVIVYTCLCTRLDWCTLLLLMFMLLSMYTSMCTPAVCRLVVTLCEHRRMKCCLRTCAVHFVRRCLSVSVVSWLRVRVRYLCTGSVWMYVYLPLDQPAGHFSGKA